MPDNIIDKVILELNQFKTYLESILLDCQESDKIYEEIMQGLADIKKELVEPIQGDLFYGK